MALFNIIIFNLDTTVFSLKTVYNTGLGLPSVQNFCTFFGEYVSDSVTFQSIRYVYALTRLTEEEKKAFCKVARSDKICRYDGKLSSRGRGEMLNNDRRRRTLLDY